MPVVSRKVLIIDASATSRALLKQAIDNIELVPDEAKNETEALQALESSNYCMIISSDQHMSLLKNLRSKNIQTPYIMTTAIYPEKMAKVLIEWNAHCLAKPLILENMEDYLGHCLMAGQQSKAA